MHKFKYLTTSIILVLSLILAILSFDVSARPLLAVAPDLGTAGSFAVLGGSTVTNTGPSVINGSLGVSPGSAVIGFPPGSVVPPGTIHAADAVAQQAQNDVTTAYDALAGQACDTNLTGQDLGGQTLTPGAYCFDSSAQLTGALTLDAQGNPNSVFVFQIGSALTTASNSSVVMVNSGSGCNVFWKVSSSATLGTTTSFQGNILALASITLNTGTNLNGRALARTGAVTLDTNDVNSTDCSAQLSTATAIANATATAIANATATATTPPPTATATTPPPTATATRRPTATATATLLPPVKGLPNAGGGPIRNENFPLSLVIIGGLSAIILAFGIRTYRNLDRPKH